MLCYLANKRVISVYTRLFSVIVGVLLHSVSSDDVTAVRSQSATDMMSRDLNTSRDSVAGDHYRRRRDRAIFERNRPETEMNRRARSYGTTNKPVSGHARKQEPPNQNGQVTPNHAPDLEVTNQSAENHNLPSCEQNQKNTATTEVEMNAKPPTNGDRSRDKRNTGPFSSFLRRLTTFRPISSKRESSVSLVGYASTDNVAKPTQRRASKERVASGVRRHESLSAFDVTAAASRRQEVRRNSIAASDAPSTSQSDTGTTSRTRGGLRRHKSELIPTKYWHSNGVDDEESDSVASTEPGPRTSTPTRQDLVMTKSSSVSKLGGKQSAKQNHRPVRHESFTSKDDARSPTDRQEPVRYKSQAVTADPSVVNVTGSRSRYYRQPEFMRSRNGTAVLKSGDLVRHRSLPTIVHSGGRDFISSRDMVAASPLCNSGHEQRKSAAVCNEVPAPRRKWQPRRDVVASSRSHDARPTCHNNVMTSTMSYNNKSVTALRRHHSAHHLTAPDSTGIGLNDLEIRREPGSVVSTEIPQRHDSLTSRPIRHDFVNKSSSATAGKPKRSSSSVQRGQTSTTHQIPNSTDPQSASQVRPSAQKSSTTSSKGLNQGTKKTTPVSEPHAMSKPDGPQTSFDNADPVPTPRKKPSRISPSMTQSLSSSKRHDQVTRKPALMPKPRVVSTSEGTQNSSDSVQPVPTPKQEGSQVPPSSMTSSKEQATRKPGSVPKPNILSAPEDSQFTSDSTHPVPKPRKKTSKTSSTSPRSATSNGQDRVTRKSATESKSHATERNQTTSDSAQPVRAKKEKSSLTSSSSPSRKEQTVSVSSGTSSTERNEARSISVLNHEPTNLPQISNQSLSLSPHSSSSTSSSAVDRDSSRTNTATTISRVERPPDLDHSLSPYQHEGPETPANELDETSRRRSRRETANNVSKSNSTEPQLQSLLNREQGDLEELSESRSRREIANVVVVRPLPTSGHLLGAPGTDADETKSRSKLETVSQTPIAATTESDCEIDMRSWHRSASDASIANGMKSALRKKSRSQSCDRHVSYSATDTVYRLVRPTCSVCTPVAFAH